MKPIIIPVEKGKITITLDEFRKYMEEAYDQGHRDGRNTNTLTNIPGNGPYWWRDSAYTPTTGTLDTNTVKLTNQESGTSTKRTIYAHINTDGCSPMENPE